MRKRRPATTAADLPRWAAEYLELSIVAVEFGLIDDLVFRRRIERLTNGDEINFVYQEKERNGISEAAIETDTDICSSPSYLADPLMHFRLPPDYRGSEWVFSSRDTDPLPSIPHGHWRDPANKKKLDPYLGHIYVGRRQIGERLDWTECKRFWRHAPFRQFARAAIIAALNDPRMSAKEHFKSRRISNPLRLPR